MNDSTITPPAVDPSASPASGTDAGSSGAGSTSPGLWYLVVGAQQETSKPSAYRDPIEANAIANAYNYTLAAIGPWSVVPVAPIQ